MPDLMFTGLVRQAELLASGEVSSRELVALSLNRIHAGQETLGAFRVVRAEQARLEADAADRALAAGERRPLLGVPIAIKDDTDLAGETTPFGCAGDHRPRDQDSEVVRRLRAAGAVIVGKTTTSEFGQWPMSETPCFGKARNPWHLAYTPGGSSGGSAAAVAAGLVPAALGSDGLGSVRIPAAWTGLVGLKPQRGRISAWPHADPFYGLTVYGPLTRTVADAALLMTVLSGNHDGDVHRPAPPERPFTDDARRPPGRLRIAVSFRTPFGVAGKVDPEIRSAVERLAAVLGELGHEVFPADPTYGLVGLSVLPRGTVGIAEWLDATPCPDPEPRTRTEAWLGRVVGRRLLPAALRMEPALQRRVGQIFTRADLVLTPTTARPPLPVGALDGRGWWATGHISASACPFAWAWNVLGWPAISVPAGLTRRGLPIGAQLLGAECGEGTLLSVAAQLEQVERWAERRPPELRPAV